MSNFDIAIGLSANSVNSILAALFADSTAKAKFFRGIYSEDIAGKGTVYSSYEVNAAPTVTLAAPDQASWDAAIKQTKDQPLPTENCFQIHFSSISGTISIDNGSPVNGEGQLDVYMTAAMSNGVLSLDPLAVYMDTSSLSQFDKWLIPNVLAPAALEMASKIMDTIKLPSIPSYEDISFIDPGLSIMNEQLIIATVLTNNSASLSLTGFSPPTKNYYTLLSPTLINAVIQSQKAKIEAGFENYKSGEEKVGDDVAAWAKGTYELNLKDFSAVADASNPTQVNISVKADISVSGSAGGLVPALACPIGAALNAF
ncbi:hypothetical protein [Moorena producens]|uniref:hypothetical protein n=1 Tax=Moorena producens TaxID=1155739 RepID=UPI003C751EF2